MGTQKKFHISKFNVFLNYLLYLIKIISKTYLIEITFLMKEQTSYYLIKNIIREKLPGASVYKRKEAVVQKKNQNEN